jgi:hypothetical protein
MPLLAGIIIPVLGTQTAQAVTALGDFAQGRDAGLADGAAAYNAGEGKRPTSCPGPSTNWCRGYGFGFVEGWEAQQKISPR